ncbi:hypothetical protein NMD1_03928 [Novosphingobium sp. MD-1]|nr:hypothetical protein NMD1_03928 [Novosphingobium sp. MD-1]
MFPPALWRDAGTWLHSCRYNWRTAMIAAWTRNPYCPRQ